MWGLLAYLARYAHQPLNVLLGMTLQDARRLSSAVAKIVREENEANTPPEG